MLIRRPRPAVRPWDPMEFMAAVDAAGLVGPVVPTTRSGVAEVDAYFSRYLAETLRVGQTPRAWLLPHDNCGSLKRVPEQASARTFRRIIARCVNFC